MGGPNAWWNDHAELVTFARVLAGAGAFDHDDRQRKAIEQVVFYFEKPWRYDDEHEAWTRLGRPAIVEDLEQLGATS